MSVSKILEPSRDAFEDKLGLLRKLVHAVCNHCKAYRTCPYIDMQLNERCTACPYFNKTIKDGIEE